MIKGFYDGSTGNWFGGTIGGFVFCDDGFEFDCWCGGASESGLNLSTVYLIAFIYAGLVYFLWAFPMTIAHRVLPKTNGTEKIITNHNQVAVEGVALIGLLLSVEAFPSLIAQFNYAFLMQKQMAVDSLFEAMVFSENRKLNLLNIVFELMLALILMLNARKVVRFLTR